MRINVIEAMGRTLTLCLFVSAFWLYMFKQYWMSIILILLFAISIIIETSTDEKERSKK